MTTGLYEDNKFWIETFTGRRFDPLHPDPELIDLEDIAHSLSLLCRFIGHCKQFYSVAEHCIRVAELCSIESKLAALLHDAAEAYIGDIARPIKYGIASADLKEAEERLLGTIYKKFGASPYDAKEVKEADDIMLATEARDLMYSTEGWYLPMPATRNIIIPMTSGQAEQEYLDYFFNREQ